MTSFVPSSLLAAILMEQEVVWCLCPANQFIRSCYVINVIIVRKYRLVAVNLVNM